MQTTDWYEKPSQALGGYSVNVIIWTGLTMLLMLLGGCASPQAGRLPESSSHLMELDAGYVILRELLADEANLDSILLIKSTSASTESLLRDIAEASSDMLRQLDQMAEENPELTLAFNGLPQVEVMVRDAIASRTGMQLLSSNQDDFEYLVLISQDSAMSYGMHLADALSDMEPDAGVARQFKQMSERMSALHNRVKARLMSLCGDSSD